jgi:ELWxxDGT repeat protein
LGPLVAVGEDIYFKANDGLTGSELWKTDGTADGTVLVADISPGPASTSIRNLAAVGHTLFFTDNGRISSQSVATLWKSDGTASGTVPVKGGWSSDLNQDKFPSTFYSHNGLLFFRASEGQYETELWKSDGTEAGTVTVKDVESIPPGGPEDLSVVGNSFAAIGTELYFSRSDLPSGTALWKTDGTEAGTTLVKVVTPVFGRFLLRLTNVNGTLYFIDSNTLWKSDGTEEGTVPLRYLRSSSVFDASNNSFPSALTSVGGMLYFVNDDRVNGLSLWQSDGTTEGTHIADFIDHDTGNNFVNKLFAAGDRLYVVATTEQHGAELWTARTDVPPLVGDFDRDGAVNGFDFLVWQRRAGAAAAPPTSGADANGDGQVDAGDLAVWQAAFAARPKRDAAVATFRPGSRLDYLNFAAAQHLSIPRPSYRPTAQAADAALLAENVARPAFRPQLYDAAFAGLDSADAFAAQANHVNATTEQQDDLTAVDNLLAQWQTLSDNAV